MSLLAQLPEHSLFSAPTRANSQAVDPDEWNAWIGLGTAIGAAALWLWRHSLGGFVKWLWNGLKAPGRIEDLFRLHKEQQTLLLREITEAKSMAEYAMVTSRIAWSFVERPVLQFDSLGMCAHVNEFVLHLLVRQQDEFHGSGWRTLIHPEDADRVERQWDAAVRDQRNFAQTFRIMTSNGDSIKVFDRAEVLHDRAGNVLGWYHLMSITD